MSPQFNLLYMCLLASFYIFGSSAIIANGKSTDGNDERNIQSPAHLVTFTTSSPTRQAESKVDDPSRQSQLESIQRHSLHSSSSHHYPEYHSGLSYGGGFDFGGDHGGGYGGGNSLEGGGFGDFNSHQHRLPNHGKQHNHKAIALKGLLVPLAGVALLGAAAALVSNPILLQLGVITGKKRRRRDSDADISRIPNLNPAEAEAVQQKLNEIALLERFIAQVPKEQAVTQEKQLLANYLSCTGSPHGNSTTCLERLTCELHHPGSDATQLEKHVMSIVTSEILGNEYVPEDVKKRVKLAATTGSLSGNCGEFPCNDLEGN